MFELLYNVVSADGPVWGNDQDNHPPVGGAGWPQLRTPSVSSIGADQADVRYYGTSPYNGSFPGVIGARTTSYH